MTSIKRRHFLQIAGSTLAALGLHEANFFQQSEHYGRVLAQPTGRKLALLVGVNQYKDSIRNLQGCLTDVEMQRQLLVHRYGFNPKDILILSDEAQQKPTRENILTAFDEHLIKQAAPGDIVVFHYSGHGSRVVDPNPIPTAEGGLNGTLVPSDTRLASGNIANDIMGKTLFLLSRAVNTDFFTMVLDSCHSGGGTRGNLVFRNIEPRSGAAEAKPSEQELNFQEQWLTKLNLSPEQFQAERVKGIARGMALGSAEANQLAADMPFGDFYAGAFTYLLTRYLWQLPSSESLQQSFNRLALITRDVAESSGLTQNPLSFTANPAFELQPIYFLSDQRPSADAVLQKVDGQNVEFWLGGVSSGNLKSFEKGAKFDLIDENGNPLGEVEQTSRLGLKGYGRLVEAPSQTVGEGSLMREKLRIIPANLSLKVGLDPSLGRNLATAQQALRKINRIEPVIVDQSQPVDILLGRLTPEAVKQAQQRNIDISVPPGSVGLLSQSATPVTRSFLGGPNEPIEATIGRLRPRLKMLLAGKILKELLNDASHNVKVDVDIAVKEGDGPRGTLGSRSAGSGDVISRQIDFSKPYKPGTLIDVTVKNNDPIENLFMGVMVISDDGSLDLLHPVDWAAPEAAALVEKKGGKVPVELRLVGPAGFTELLVITSTKPLKEALQAMKTIARGRGLQRGSHLSFNEETTRSSGESEDTVVDLVDHIVSDVSTRAGVQRADTRKTISTDSLAVFSVILEVGEP